MTTAQLSETRRTLALADLRTEFALRLASMYGTRIRPCCTRPQQSASLAAAAEQLGLTEITTDWRMNP